MHKQLCELINAKHVPLIGANGENLGKCFAVLAEARPAALRGIFVWGAKEAAPGWSTRSRELSRYFWNSVLTCGLLNLNLASNARRLLKR